MNKKYWWHDLADLLIFVWNKTGTASAIALMAGGVAMALYYINSPRASDHNYEAFEGFFNHACTKLPEGIGQKITPTAQSNKAQVRFEYGDDERLQRVYHLNAAGELSNIPGSALAEQLLSYDEAGRLVSKKNRDAYGQPVHDAAGVHERRFRYDQRGNLVETSYWDKNLARTMPYTPGFAIERIVYDELDRPIEKTYLDAHERPVENSRGHDHLKISYDGQNHTMENYHNSELTVNSKGYAIERHSISNNGRIERIDWLDEKGLPTINEEYGCASMQIERAEDGSHQRVLYLDTTGQQRPSKRVLSEHVTKFNDKGQPRWESFLASDGLPYEHHKHGYAECAREFDNESRLTKEHFRNACGELAHCYEQRYSYTPEGKRVLSLYRDGSTASRMVK